MNKSHVTFFCLLERFAREKILVGTKKKSKIVFEHVYRAWMQASPRRGCVSQGYPLAIINGCSSLFRRKQLQSRSTWVSLTLYMMVSFITRCCASAKTLVLLFLGGILQHPSYPTSLHKLMPRFWRRFAEKVQLTRWRMDCCLSPFFDIKLQLRTQADPARKGEAQGEGGEGKGNG